MNAQKSRNGQNLAAQAIAEKDVFKNFPNLLILAHKWDPLSFEGTYSEQREWICPKGHLHSASIRAKILGSRTKSGGCSVCSNRKIIIGVNDFATTHPHIARDADGWDPTSVTAGSEKRVNWKCELGHQWQTTVGTRAVLGRGCATCSGRKVLAGFNDLGTTHPHVAAEAHGWNPQEVSHGSEKFMFWKCAEGHFWNAIIQSRASGKNNSGCPQCSITGFHPEDDGYIYLMKHEVWSLYKIGISNSISKRTNEHKRAGWLLIDMIGPLDGLLIQSWERDILKFLKLDGADFSGKKVAGRFDGHTETWTVDSYKTKSIKEILKKADLTE